jgi:hypothetical protein
MVCSETQNQINAQKDSHWRETTSGDTTIKVSDWTEKRVCLPRRAKSATSTRSRSAYRYNVILQSQDEHQRQWTTGLFRGFTENSLETTTDPLGRASPVPTSQLSGIQLASHHLALKVTSPSPIHSSLTSLSMVRWIVLHDGMRITKDVTSVPIALLSPPRTLLARRT